VFLRVVVFCVVLFNARCLQVVQTCRNLRQVRGAELVLIVRPNGESMSCFAIPCCCTNRPIFTFISIIIIIKDIYTAQDR